MDSEFLLVDGFGFVGNRVSEMSDVAFFLRYFMSDSSSSDSSLTVLTHVSTFEFVGFSRSLTAAGKKSTSLKTWGLKGSIPHFSKLFTAVLTIAALRYAFPKRLPTSLSEIAFPGLFTRKCSQA
ncbi:hypothetical protein ABEB36_009504 [Hypothenemus hampei]|uniref:Uncharacterized protein n=1 Tax=Hypothenemus hampei TaxID=57062 RepID=A0ABD1EGK5_HYPHA